MNQRQDAFAGTSEHGQVRQAQQADDQLQALKQEMGMLPPAEEKTEEKVRNIEV